MKKPKKPGAPASSASRRKALQKLGMGGALVSISKTWQKPVVDSVMVPAHAQTSEPQPY